MFGSVQAVLCKFLQRTHRLLTLYVSSKHAFRTSWKSRLMLSRFRYSFPVHILASLVAMLFIMFLLAFETISHHQPPDPFLGQTSLGKNQRGSRQIPTLVTATLVSSMCFGAHDTFCSHRCPKVCLGVCQCFMCRCHLIPFLWILCCYSLGSHWSLYACVKWVWGTELHAGHTICCCCTATSL